MTTRAGELDRLRRMARQGDAEARERLLRAARRRGDVDEALATLLGESPTPSPMAFLDLCRLLDQFEGGEIDRLVELAEARLATWPAHARPVPLAWLEALGEQDRAHPGLALTRSISLWGWPLPSTMRAGGLPALLTHPALGHIRSARLEDDLASVLGHPGSGGEAGLARMCELEHLHVTALRYGLVALLVLVAQHPRALRSLSLCAPWSERCGEEHWARLAEACPQLEALAVVNSGLPDRGVVNLSRTPLYRQLTRLSLRGNALTGAAVRALARARQRPRRLALDVRGQTTGALTTRAELTPLARALELDARVGAEPRPERCPMIDRARLPAEHRRTVLRQARSLSLGPRSLDADSARVWSAELAPGRLRQLRIVQGPVDEATCRVVASASTLGGLELLELDQCGVTHESLFVLLSSAALRSLRELAVRGSILNGTSATGPLLVAQHLETLALVSAGGSSQTHEALWSVPWPSLHTLDLRWTRLDAAAIDALVNAQLPALRRLNLSSTGLGPAAMRRLASASWLVNLESLDLCGCPIGDMGAQVLATHDQLGNLRRLRLDHCEMSREGLESLMRSACLSAWCEIGHAPHARIERTTAPSARARRAHQLLDALLRAGQLELVEDADVNALAEALSSRLDALILHRAPGPLLADWLLARDEVEDLYADDARLTAWIQTVRHA